MKLCGAAHVESTDMMRTATARSALRSRECQEQVE
jgi:hypothetical protein